MILPILPMKYQMSNCLLSACSSYINYAYGDCTELLRFGWNFSLIRQDSNLADRILLFDYDEIAQFMKATYGVDIKLSNVILEDDLFTVIYKEIKEGRPVGFTVDFFWCPWNRSYMEDHSDFHFILIIGWDEENFFCVDNLSSEVCSISHSSLKNAVLQILVFENCKKEESMYTWKQYIKKRKSIPDHLNRFKEEVFRTTLSSTFMRDNSTLSMLLSKKMKRLSNAYSDLCEFFLTHNFGLLCVPYAKNISYAYKRLQYLFMKMNFSNKEIPIKIEIDSVIDDLIIQEKELMKCFIESVKN